MKQYICVECNQIYNDFDKPDDYVCKKGNCSGSGLTGLIIEMENPPLPPSSESSATPPPIPIKKLYP